MIIIPLKKETFVCYNLTKEGQPKGDTLKNQGLGTKKGGICLEKVQRPANDHISDKSDSFQSLFLLLYTKHRPPLTNHFCKFQELQITKLKNENFTYVSYANLPYILI